jgi:transposase
MTKGRKQYGAAFKAKAALAAIGGHETVPELAARLGVHPNQIYTWKKAVQEGAARLFEKGNGAGGQEAEREKERLYEQIGRLTVERDFLSRKSGL